MKTNTVFFRCLSILISVPLFLFFLTVFSVKTVQATWYQESIEDGADIMMMDLRWPWWPSGTYYANWNCIMNPRPNNFSFYGGIVSYAKDGPNFLPNPDLKADEAFRPGSVWSFWGCNAQGESPCFLDVPSNSLIRNQYGGEGTGCWLEQLGWPFIKSKRWYTMVCRIWVSDEKSPKYAYIGRWIKDTETGKWNFFGIARLPAELTSFIGNSGFIEPLSDPKVIRPLDRRLGYYRKDGQWKKSDTITIVNPTFVVANTLNEGNHEYIALETSQVPDLLPVKLSGKPLENDQTYSFKVRQPDLPTFGSPEIEKVSAICSEKQIAVSWSVPETSTPSFAYKIEVFDTPQCQGTPLLVREERNPGLRDILLDSPTKNPVIRLTITDIFDQTSDPVIVSATASSQKKAPYTSPKDVLSKLSKNYPNTSNSSSTQNDSVSDDSANQQKNTQMDQQTDSNALLNGAYCQVFHQDEQKTVQYFFDESQNPNEKHYWLSLDELDQGKLVREGKTRGFDLSILEDRTFGYALKSSGFLIVPKDGLYIFRARIDGGYRICLNQEEILVRDGQQGTSEKTAVVHLEKGLFPITVDYFVDQLPVRNFDLQWEGPGFECQKISADSLLMQNSDAPIPEIQCLNQGNGHVQIDINIDAKKHSVHKTVLYLNDLQLKESVDSASLNYSGPFPQGANKIWVRILYDEQKSFDSDFYCVNIPGKEDTSKENPADENNANKNIESDWTIHNRGSQNATAGIWESENDHFELIGNGMHSATKQIKGDFTATCRIDAYNGANGEPVNPRSWIGLATFEKAKGINWDWGQFFYLARTAAEGIRTSADFSDLGAGRISTYELPSEHSWLRIIREGNAWFALTSADGKTWTIGGFQYKVAPETMSVGLFFSSLPQNARTHFFASVSNFSVEQGITKDAHPALPKTAKTTDGSRLTGVVLSRSEKNIAIIRSSDFGLLKTTDAGKTWTPINQGLSNNQGLSKIDQGMSISISQKDTQNQKDDQNRIDNSNQKNSPQTGNLPAVRSVAIHPKDPSIMICAVGTDAKNSALLKTLNGGKTWVKLNFDGDFDGSGPSALCGEVVAFDLRNPSTVYVGCESKGFFRSTDIGETWECLGMSETRITSVVIWPWETYFPDIAKEKTHLFITTCPDSWMSLLGRGVPACKLPGLTSQCYLFSEEDSAPVLMDETSNTGFYNVAADRAIRNTREVCYATSYGFMTNSGGHLSLYPEAKCLESFRPMTALGATARKDPALGRFITQVLDPEHPERLSMSDHWGFYQSAWLNLEGDLPKGGLIAAAGEMSLGEFWLFVYTDGLYISDDGGRHLTKVLTEKGLPVSTKTADVPQNK